MRVIVGAAGKLNYLKLHGMRSEERYKADAAKCSALLREAVKEQTKIGPRFDGTALTLAAAETRQGIAIACYSNVAIALPRAPDTAICREHRWRWQLLHRHHKKLASLTMKQAFITWCKAELGAQVSALDSRGDPLIRVA
jgi:hypothetical protein